MACSEECLESINAIPRKQRFILTYFEPNMNLTLFKAHVCFWEKFQRIIFVDKSQEDENNMNFTLNRIDNFLQLKKNIIVVYKKNSEFGKEEHSKTSQVSVNYKGVV